MNSTLFDCPGCGYQCSRNALSCLNCGRIFRVSQTGFTRPRTSPIIWIVTFLMVIFAVFSTIGLILNTNRNTVELGATENGSEPKVDQDAIEIRRQFVVRMQETLENSSKSTTDLIYTTEDYLEQSDTLVVTGSALMKKDCDLLANEDSGRAAARLGFNRVICRNRRLRSEWSLQLEKTNF